MFAISGLDGATRRMSRAREGRGITPDTSMTTLRRIHAATQRHNVAHWASPWLCVILGAYFSLQLVQNVGL
jgi:hypothetical protein